VAELTVSRLRGRVASNPERGSSIKSYRVTHVSTSPAVRVESKFRKRVRLSIMRDVGSVFICPPTSTDRNWKSASDRSSWSRSGSANSSTGSRDSSSRPSSRKANPAQEGRVKTMPPRLELVEQFNDAIEQLYKVTAGDPDYSVAVLLHQLINEVTDDASMERILEAVREQIRIHSKRE
jgi:hypothetical protein